MTVRADETNQAVVRACDALLVLADVALDVSSTFRSELSDVSEVSVCL